MAGFKQLRDVGNSFEQQLRSVSVELYSVKVGEPFESVITKKLQDISLLSAKLRLLNGKTTVASTQGTTPKAEDTVTEYGDIATWKVLEQCIVKYLTQAHSVKALISTPDHSLDPELVERKENIISDLQNYRRKESQLRQLDAVWREKQEELAAVRGSWDRELTELREMRERVGEHRGTENMGPLYSKLKVVVGKLELMRWLISRLVCARGRDWLAEPNVRVLRTLALAREHHTMEMFTNN